jgi:hypothetical protein
MHPLIAAAVSAQLVRERTHLARSHRRAETRGTPEEAHIEPSDVVIRLASPADAAALVRLGALDGNRSAGELLAEAAPDHAVLVAEVDGSIEAALALEGGLAVADPFRPSALHVQLLSLRSRQLGGDAPRRRGQRLSVLHPRTS